MLKISDVVKWRQDETGNGDLGIVGKIEVGAQATIKREVRDDDKLRDHAKRSITENIYREVYGDMDKRLARLEQMLVIALQPQYVTVGRDDDGPLSIVRELQAELQSRR